MTELRRLGEIVDFDSDYRIGEKRIIKGLDNLGGKIMFPEENLVIKELYVSCTPTKRVVLPSPLDEIEIGDYEGSVLDKLMNPVDPVLCIKGRTGSGKTTLIRFLMENYVSKLECQCEGNHPPKRLTAWVDFRNLVTESAPTLHDLLATICTQLWSKCIYHIDDKFEFNQFWDYLLVQDENSNDSFVEQVVGAIHTEYPEIRRVRELDNEEITRRRTIKSVIRDKNLIWYLRYLVLLYRYLIQTKFLNHKECALVILDNVDSLTTELQRNLLRIVVGCAHTQGPTFVILVRPETFERHGLNDVLRDVVEHQNPEPHQIVLDRLERFLKEPERYFQVAQTVTPDEKSLVLWYLKRIIPKLRGRVYREFINSVSGRNIRNALVLAQSIFQLTVGEMKRRDLTSQYLIRAMVRFGHPQFRSYQNPRITNPFDVKGAVDGRYLTKIRLLKYIAGHGGSCHTPTIINIFSMFNPLNLISTYDVVTNALEELLSNDSQLLTSNGFDAFHITPEDDQDEISITEVGKSYIDKLIFNIHFIQEVMLDARVEANFPIPKNYNDRLSEKIEVMINFLEKMYIADVDEVQTFLEKGIGDYAKLFQPQLISYEIIQKTFSNTKKLFQSRKLRARKDVVEEYDEILEDFENLLYRVKASNHRLFGVTYDTRSEPE
jgi:hypothetical protein